MPHFELFFVYETSSDFQIHTVKIKARAILQYFHELPILSGNHWPGGGCQWMCLALASGTRLTISAQGAPSVCKSLRSMQNAHVLQILSAKQKQERPDGALGPLLCPRQGCKRLGSHIRKNHHESCTFNKAWLRRRPPQMYRLLAMEDPLQKSQNDRVRLNDVSPVKIVEVIYCGLWDPRM